MREGKAAARITSEHVARVFDTGVLENGAPYLVMEYLEGADLGQVVARRGRLAPAEAVEYVLQACEALAEAHQLGIVHRDLKPANLFLTQRKDGSPLVKVLDFGISKSESGSKRDLTSTSAVMGSPRYMSPEQMLSAKHVDARTDIWALGVILHELVTGAPVWDAETLQGLCVLITTAPAPPLRTIVPDAPEALERAILGCLAKAPADRIPDVAALARALAPVAPERARTSIERILGLIGDKPATATAPPPQTSTTPAAPATSPTRLDAAVSVAPAPRPSRRVPLGVLAATALVLGGAGVLGGLRFLRPPVPPAVKAVMASTGSAAPTGAIASTEPSAEPPPPATSAASEPSAAASAPRARPRGGTGAPKPKPPATTPSTPSTPDAPDRAVSERK